MPYPTSLIPIYHLRGPLPTLFDLPPDHCGWLICLSFTQMGDTCLLPIAWETQQLTRDDPRTLFSPPISTQQTQALDDQAIALTLDDLQRSGWQLNGRLTLHFTGHDTDPTFHQTIHSYLWQMPEKDE